MVDTLRQMIATVKDQLAEERESRLANEERLLEILEDACQQIS